MLHAVRATTLTITSAFTDYDSRYRHYSQRTLHYKRINLYSAFMVFYALFPSHKGLASGDPEDQILTGKTGCPRPDKPAEDKGKNQLFRQAC